MMPRAVLRPWLLLSLVLGSVTPVLAQERPMAWGLDAGTTGLGLQLHVGMNETFNWRFGYDHFSGGQSASAQDNNGSPGDELKYSANLKLRSLGLIADLYPWAGHSFHASAGIIFSDNDLQMDARCDNPTGCEVGNARFSRTEIGTITTEIDTQPIGPYVGIGWGNPVAADLGWHWSLELGVIYHGAPEVTMTSDGNCASLFTSCSDELQREEDELEDSLSDLVLFPVISLGLSYRFQ